MSIFEKVFGHRPMGPAEDENSSGGSALPDLKDGEIHIFDQALPKEGRYNTGGVEVKPLNGKKVVSQQKEAGGSNGIEMKPVQPEPEKGDPINLKMEPVVSESKTAPTTVTIGPKEKKERLPRRMDIFENSEGKRRVVQRIEKDGTVVYAEELAKDISAKKGAYLSRAPLRNFRVSAHVEGMEKIDPIKEKHPEFYAEYEEGMEKLAEAFVREFAAVTEQVDTWSESLTEAGDRDLYDWLYGNIERIGNEWNELDDRFVEQGRRRIQLFAEFRSLEEKVGEAVKGDIEKLREGYAAENYAELAKQVENGCRKISFEETEKRLNEIAKRIQEKYDSALAGKIPIADDALSALEFGRKVNGLLTSINEQSSPEETEKIFAALDELEKRTFVKKKAFGNGKNGEEYGGRVKTIKKRPRDEDTGKPKDEKKKETSARTTVEWTPIDTATEPEPVVVPVVTPASENKVESKGVAPPSMIADVPTQSPFVREDTNSMPPREIPAQENPKKQEFFDAFSRTFEDLKERISNAENIVVLKALRPGKGKEKYKFFVLDTFADYFNNQRGNEGDRARVEAFGKLESAEEELQKLYDARRDQLKKMAPKPASEKQRIKRTRVPKSVSRKPSPFDEDDAARNTSANGGAPDYEQAKYLARVEAGKKAAVEQPKSQERTYEELEKASSKIERGQCASVVIEGLKPYMVELERGKSENPDLKLKDIIEHFGVDEVAKSFVPAIAQMLSSEWKGTERDLFALEFAKKEITGYFE